MLALGVLSSGFFLWLGLRQVDSRSLARAFTAVDGRFVLASAAAVVVGIMLRALRWRVIAAAPPSAQRSFFRATSIGALSNMLLPGRVGEFVRVVTLARLSGARLAVSVASAVIDRLIDVFVLIGSAVGLYFVLPLGAELHRLLVVLMSGGALIGAALVVLVRSGGVWQAVLARIASRWLHRWGLRPDAFLGELQTEIRHLLQGWLSVKLVLIAALILLADCATMAASIRALQLSLPFVAALLLWVFLSAGSLLPAAPGYVGVYQVAAVWALTFFGVSAASAVAVAVVLQITALAVAFCLSGPSFWRFARSALAARD
jgi:uncharacterized protein (TIRG00374 family)